MSPAHLWLGFFSVPHNVQREGRLPQPALGLQHRTRAGDQQRFTASPQLAGHKPYVAGGAGETLGLFRSFLSLLAANLETSPSPWFFLRWLLLLHQGREEKALSTEWRKHQRGPERAHADREAAGPTSPGRGSNCSPQLYWEKKSSPICRDGSSHLQAPLRHQWGARTDDKPFGFGGFQTLFQAHSDAVRQDLEGREGRVWGCPSPPHSSFCMEGGLEGVSCVVPAGQRRDVAGSPQEGESRLRDGQDHTPDASQRDAQHNALVRATHSETESRLKMGKRWLLPTGPPGACRSKTGESEPLRLLELL